MKFRIWASSNEYPDGRYYYPGDAPIVLTLFGDPIHAPNGLPIDKCCFMRVGWNDIVVELFEGEGDNIKVIATL